MRSSRNRFPWQLSLSQWVDHGSGARARVSGGGKAAAANLAPGSTEAALSDEFPGPRRRSPSAGAARTRPRGREEGVSRASGRGEAERSRVAENRRFGRFRVAVQMWRSPKAHPWEAVVEAARLFP
nr:unnamed protein product [Digitaria exilis]